MSEVNMVFGASDLGGPKNTSPRDENSPDAAVLNETLKRKQLSRVFAILVLVFLSLAAAACLVFSMYVGCHFLEILDDTIKQTHQLNSTISAPQVGSPAETAESLRAIESSDSDSDSLVPKTDSRDSLLYFQLIASLIPASFSSALAIILFITIARFATNFERMGQEEKPGKTDDYGTIAALFRELAQLIQSFRSKE